MYSEITNSKNLSDHFTPPSEIVKILKNSTNTRHKKDITSDIVENIVLKRLENIKLPNNGNDEKETKYPPKKFIPILLYSCIYLFIFIVWMFIGFLYLSNKLNKTTEIFDSNFKGLYKSKSTLSINDQEKKNWAIEPPFSTITDLKIFGNFKIYGKNQRLQEVIRKLKKNIFNIESKSEDELIKENFDVTDKNFLFYGEPGTGKTLFIKALVYRLDLELKIANEIKKAGGKEEFDKLNFSKEYIENLPSQVVFVQVNPSDIFSKWLGESEKAVRNLFNYLDYLETDKTVIVFFDEADAIFGDLRDVFATRHDSNVRAQFLGGLDGVSTQRKRKTFIFAATNYLYSMGDAISRRLKNKYEFAFPDITERGEIFTVLLPKEIYEDPAKIEELKNSSEGMATTSITECIDYAKAVNINKDADELYKTLIDVIGNRELLHRNIHENMPDNQNENLEYDKYI